MKYSKGYKYQLRDDFSIQLEMAPLQPIFTDYVAFNTKGLLYIKKGYAWDGASGPALDTDSIMVPALVHDAIYQLLRQGELVGEQYRYEADREFRRLCGVYGVWWPRRQWVYAAVRLFGASSASPENKHVILEIPDPE